VAIVQISQITNRLGLQQDLPQLAGAEFGWSTDTRQLYIGNGTLEQGAPVVGNTEILTEFSDILAINSSYTYKGSAAGYTVQTGPTAGTPVTQSLQSWLDQFATVKDFGAVGDGVTDDTVAINRALYQLYCREINPQIRRSLFFPAGVYRITGTINIPPYATLYGEGIEGSVILMDTATGQPVAQTADSLQQTGANIASNGATPPCYITISNMGFHTQDTTTSVFLIQDANNCRFQNVSFSGPATQSTLISDAPATSCVEFASTVTLICQEIVFDGCLFSGAVWGINTDQQIQGSTVVNSKFDTLYKGILLGTNTPPVSSSPTGVKIHNNVFDNIYAEGIVFGPYATLCATGYNIFYDVGDHFQGTTNPYTVIIDIKNANNVSIGDMFERSDIYSTTFARITLNNTASIAMTNGAQLALGTYVIETGQTIEIINNSTVTIFTINTDVTRAFSVNYTILRGNSYRTGTMMVTTNSGPVDLTYTEDFVENTGHYQGTSTLGSPGTGVTLTASQVANAASAILQYTASNSGINGSMTYSINHLA
jgi:hypothetical protein